MKKHNFSAGPSILPQVVFKEASKAVINFRNNGLSILEISHRSKDFIEVLDEAKSLVSELLDLPETHKVLFLTGGASSQFFMVAMNLLDKNEKAYYLDTGTWSTKAIKEAKSFGNIELIGSSKDKNFTYIPKGFKVPTDGKYVHYTSNNTIRGTQMHVWPEKTIPVVCDMSSDIFGKPVDSSYFDLMYAGAQKNLGPAGVTLVIVNEELLGKVERHIPTMLDYRTHIAKDSMFNTPPTFPIYVCLLNLRYIKETGGIPAMYARNSKKAQLLYDEIDRNSMFVGTVAYEDRSLMNVPFLLQDDSKNQLFLEACDSAGIVGIKGHRSVGGFRASIYNSMPIESVQALVDVMKAFEDKYGN